MASFFDSLKKSAEASIANATRLAEDSAKKAKQMSNEAMKQARQMSDEIVKQTEETAKTIKKTEEYKNFIRTTDEVAASVTDVAKKVGTQLEETSKQAQETISQTIDEVKETELYKQASDAVDVVNQQIDDLKATEEYKAVAKAMDEAADATVKGAKVVSGVQGYEDRQEVMALNAKAEKIKSETEAQTEKLRKNLNDGLENLGRIRITALHNTIGRFISCLKRLNQSAKAKEYEFLNEVDIDPGHIKEMEQLDMEAGDALKVLAVGGSFAAVGVAATPAAVTLAVTSMCAASTGTAISTLSGVAAHNAVLAWLGGGAVASGGGGMATGAMVMGALTGGVAIGAAVISIGSLTSAFYSRKLTETTKYLAAVEEWSAEVRKSWVALEAMHKRIEEIKNVTTELESRAMLQMEKLEALIPTFDNSNRDYVKTFQQAAIMAKSMSELAQTPLLDADGNLTEESMIVAQKTQKIINTNL